MLRHRSESGPQASVPTPVRVVIALRVGRLPEITRQHLSTAAVIGRRFDLDLLGAIVRQADPSMPSSLPSTRGCCSKSGNQSVDSRSPMH
jgi:hypothetical protein